MGTPVDAVGPVIAVGGRLKRLRRGIRMRGHGWSDMRRTTVARERGGCRSRGSPGASLREISAHMRRDGSAAHVIVASGTVHIQRRKLTTR
jgi:hypothetical protein